MLNCGSDRAVTEAASLLPSKQTEVLEERTRLDCGQPGQLNLALLGLVWFEQHDKASQEIGIGPSSKNYRRIKLP